LEDLTGLARQRVASWNIGGLRERLHDSRKVDSWIELWRKSLRIGLCVNVMDIRSAEDLLEVSRKQTPRLSLLTHAFRRKMKEFAEAISLRDPCARELHRLGILNIGLHISLAEGISRRFRDSSRGGQLWFLSDGAMVDFCEMDVMYLLWTEVVGVDAGDSVMLSPQISLRTFGDSLEYLREAANAGAGWMIDSPGVIYAVMHPHYKCNCTMQLHSDRSPAIAWQNGDCEFWYQGVKVATHVPVLRGWGAGSGSSSTRNSSLS
jgi:hypothetical protein